MPGIDNRRLALEFMEALPISFSDARSYLADRFVWWSPRAGEIQDNLEAIINGVKQHLKAPIQFTVTGVTAEDDRVAIEAASYAELHNGVVYQNLYHFLLLFQDGKITVVREYNDTQHAAEVWSRT